MKQSPLSMLLVMASNFHTGSPAYLTEYLLRDLGIEITRRYNLKTEARFRCLFALASICHTGSPTYFTKWLIGVITEREVKCV